MQSIDTQIRDLADHHGVPEEVIAAMVRLHPSSHQNEAKILPFRPQLQVLD